MFFTDKEYECLNHNFWTINIVYPDAKSDDDMIENLLSDCICYNDIEVVKSLKEIYYLLQKFFRSYNLFHPPKNFSWHKFLYDEVDRWSDTEEEAYEWVCEIAKIYARKLRERGLITVEEESNLFSGPVIELKEEDKYFLKSSYYKDE